MAYPIQLQVVGLIIGSDEYIIMDFTVKNNGIFCPKCGRFCSIYKAFRHFSKIVILCHKILLFEGVKKSFTPLLRHQHIPLTIEEYILLRNELPLLRQLSQ